MDAMSYESLLRGIYKVGRFGKDGVDATYYRRMEVAKRAYDLDVENDKKKKPPISSKTIDDLLYDYQVECVNVWRNITDAVEKGIKEHSHLLSDIEVSELKACINEPRNAFKENIDNAINVSSEIFMKHKIYP